VKNQVKILVKRMDRASVKLFTNQKSPALLLDYARFCIRFRTMRTVVQTGDLIRVQRLGYVHVGVYVGPSWDRRDVVHNDKWGGVVLSTLAEFAGGAPIELHKSANCGYHERRAIAERAKALIGRKFDLLSFNCEHAASLALSGQSESPQLQAACLLLLLLGGLFLASRSS